MGCGHIGHAAFTASWDLLKQDDLFYESQNCTLPGGWRPSVTFFNGVRDRLWFDMANSGVAANVSRAVHESEPPSGLQAAQAHGKGPDSRGPALSVLR